MGRSIRQQARAQALEAAGQRRRERAAAEKRRISLGVDVAVALAERDAATRRHELQAGRALVLLTRDESLRVADVEEWVPDVPPSEIRRLRRLAEDAERVLSSAREDSDGAA